MSGRFAVGVLLTIACLAPQIARGQGPGYPPPAGAYCPPGYPAPPVFAPAYPPGAPIGPSPNHYYEQLPDDKGFHYEQTPVDYFLTRAFARTWFRLEYLLWDISDPDELVLGAPTGFDARQIFPVVDPVTGALIGTATAPNLDSISLHDTNGIRGTIGVPLTFGTIEASVFGLEQSGDEFDSRRLPTLRDLLGVPVPNLIAQPFAVNGIGPDADPLNNTTGTFLIYDQGFIASYRTDVWGSQANFVWDAHDPNEGFQLRPLVGVRYINVHERLDQFGVASSTDAAGNPITLNRQISSDANNHVYGPQVGVRWLFVHKWFELGAEPKVMLGANTYKASVSSSQILTPDDLTFSQDTDTTFGIIADIGVHAKVNVNHFFSLFVGYNLVFVGNTTRPENNIVYNINALGQNDVHLDQETSGDFYMQGLTVGGELRFK